MRVGAILISKYFSAVWGCRRTAPALTNGVCRMNFCPERRDRSPKCQPKCSKGKNDGPSTNSEPQACPLISPCRKIRVEQRPRTLSAKSPIGPSLYERSHFPLHGRRLRRGISIVWPIYRSSCLGAVSIPGWSSASAGHCLRIHS